MQACVKSRDLRQASYKSGVCIETTGWQQKRTKLVWRVSKGISLPASHFRKGGACKFCGSFGTGSCPLFCPWLSCHFIAARYYCCSNKLRVQLREPGGAASGRMELHRNHSCRLAPE